MICDIRMPCCIASTEAEVVINIKDDLPTLR
jgi:hypothetical protein